jgi:hypothetical protein
MRLSLAAAAVLFVALCVGCSQPVSPTGLATLSSAGPSGAAAANVPDKRMGADVAVGASAGKETPFKGTLQGSVTVSTPLAPPLLANLIEGTGHATALGRFTLEIPHVVNTTTRIATGTYKFTAANGDALYASFTSQATVIAPGVLSAADTATIIGGTGRFDGASGSFTAERVFVMATGAITGSFEGTLSSPSGKP